MSDIQRDVGDKPGGNTYFTLLRARLVTDEAYLGNPMRMLVDDVEWPAVVVVFQNVRPIGTACEIRVGSAFTMNWDSCPLISL